MKTLYVLVGLKGSGKTFIGKLIERELNIPFISVELIFKLIKKERHYFDESYIKEGFLKTEKEIRKKFLSEEEIIIETTGIAKQFKNMITQLEIDCNIQYIKIDTSPYKCIERVLSREKKNQIEVKIEDVRKINQLATQVNFHLLGTIVNDLKNETQIIEEFQKLKNKIISETK